MPVILRCDYPGCKEEARATHVLGVPTGPIGWWVVRDEMTHGYKVGHNQAHFIGVDPISEVVSLDDQTRSARVAGGMSVSPIEAENTTDTNSPKS